jgi:hypothetical protein
VEHWAKKSARFRTALLLKASANYTFFMFIELRHFDSMLGDRERVPVPDYTPHHEAMWGTGGIAPRILNLGWKLVVIVFLLLSHMDKISRYPLERSSGAYCSRVGGNQTLVFQRVANLRYACCMSRPSHQFYLPNM